MLKIDRAVDDADRLERCARHGGRAIDDEQRVDGAGDLGVAGDHDDGVGLFVAPDLDVAAGHEDHAAGVRLVLIRREREAGHADRQGNGRDECKVRSHEKSPRRATRPGGSRPQARPPSPVWLPVVSMPVVAAKRQCRRSLRTGAERHGRP